MVLISADGLRCISENEKHLRLFDDDAVDDEDDDEADEGDSEAAAAATSAAVPGEDGGVGDEGTI